MDINNFIELAATVLANIVVITTIIKSRVKTELADIKSNTKIVTPNGETSGVAEVVSKIYDKVCKVEESISHLHAWKLTWMELSDSPVFITDTHGAVTWVNNQFLKKTGCTLSEVQGTNWYKVIHPDDRVETVKQFLNAVSLKTGFYQQFRIINQVTHECLSVTCRASLLEDSNDHKYLGILYVLESTPQKP